eukprot:jgi/Mesvir1/7919/Mv11844-RA.1
MRQLLIRFVASSRLRKVEPKRGIWSILKLAVLRSFTQLLAWAADYSELKPCRNSLDGNSTPGRAKHYNPGVQAVSSPRAAASSVPDSDPILASSCSDHGAIAEEGLQAPHLIDVPQLMYAMKRLNLSATTLSAIMDAVRESIVVQAMATAGAGHFDSGHVTPCQCCGFAQRNSHPSMLSELLDSTLDRDPEVLRWLQTEFGVQF